jgi:hypothetical protein
VEETTFLETCLPAPVLREATSSSRRLRRPSSRALQWRRVLATLRSFVDNEEDGGENSPRDLLSCSAPGPGAAAASRRPSSWARRRRVPGTLRIFFSHFCFAFPRCGPCRVYGPRQELDGFRAYFPCAVGCPTNAIGHRYVPLP